MSHEQEIEAVSTATRSLLQAALDLEREIPAALPAVDAAEGRRYLLRLLGASWDTYVEHGDVDRPAFHHAETPIRKMMADCPDADYLRAPIRLGPGRVYRLWGRIPPGTVYLGVLLYGRGGRVGARLTDADLEPDADGRFELRVATDEQAGVWLRGAGDETAVMVRQYYTDRASQPPVELGIELVGEPAAAAPWPVTADRIGQAERMLRAVFRRTLQAHQLVSAVDENRFFEIPGDRLFPTPDNTYLAARYRRGPDELVVVRGEVPAARYFSVTLYNAWLESFDYSRHRVSLNHVQLQREADGSFVACLDDVDPAHPNWLHTAGHLSGFVVARSLLPAGSAPALELEVVPREAWRRAGATTR